MIAGVCAGLAERFDISVGIVRLIFILLIILPPAAVLPYILLWILIPSEKKDGEVIDI